ncbi:MAG TPA: tetratricopeptide repeat protein, partial [Elusimicrobiales bacterium]|nr:tetratricopeptide repeat protein [Elusimicrobiales bacterium]
GDLKDYNMQVSIYGIIATQYPRHTKAPEALYEMGYIYERRLDNPDKAIGIYRRIVKDYKGNSISAKAEERIKDLSNR